MASYTQVQAIGTTGAMHMCQGGAPGCDGGNGKLYVIARNSAGVLVVVYEYDIVTDTLTDISGVTFQNHRDGSDNACPIAWFGGTVYIGVGMPSGDNRFAIYRWGGGQNWTLVDSVAAFSGTSSLSSFMDSDSTRLVYSVFQGGGSRVCRASADGTTWANQTAASAPMSKCHYSYSREEIVIYSGTLGLTNLHINNHSGGAVWAAIDSGAFDTRSFAGECGGYSFFKNSGAAMLYRSTTWGTSDTQIAGNWYTQNHTVIHSCSGQGVGCGVMDIARDDVGFWNPTTLTFDNDGTPNAGNVVVPRPAVYNGYLYVLVSGVGIYRRDEAIFDIGFSPSPNQGDRADAMDVSADDYYLHIGVILGGNPVELRMLADLSANPIKAYDPGAGDCITVKCGDLNEQWIWIAGDFGTPLVRVSIDDGTNWTTKDPGTWNGNARPLVVGPDEDNLVLVPTDGDDDLFETEEGGLTWTTLNAALPFDVGGMDRLDLNWDEIIIGSDADRNIRYTPNNAATLHDLTDASMGDVPITDLIIG